jgi:cell wall assembly regulator SMI1
MVRQVIVLGRDEDAMFVIDNISRAFLDRLIRKVDDGGADFIVKTYRHDLPRSEIVQG